MVCSLPVVNAFLNQINKFRKSFYRVEKSTSCQRWVQPPQVISGSQGQPFEGEEGGVCGFIRLPPSPSPKQAHSNQQCNWNATTVWRRKGNFWQGEAEQLGALFRLKHRRPFIISTTRISKSIALCFYSWDLF